MSDPMSDLRVIRYFTSSLSQSHPAGWYFVEADNVNNIDPNTNLIASTNLAAAANPSLEEANRIYLDASTPAGNISGGGGDDEFYVTAGVADGIIIADSEGENVVIFAAPTSTTDNAGVTTTKSIAIKSTNIRSVLDIPQIDLVIETTTTIGNNAPTTSEATLTVKGIQETSGDSTTGITRFSFETGNLANLKLTATDLVNYLSGDFTFPNARYVVEKDENTTGAVLVVSAVEKDRDLGPVSYFITDASNPNIVGGGKLFAINESTGQISLNQALNYEQDPQSYTLTIVATEGTNSAMAEVQVHIGNVDEGKAGFIITSTRALPGGVGESITSNDHFDAPQVGDELNVVVVTPDPDGIAEIYYDWFRRTPVGPVPNENFRTTEPSYILTEDDLRFRMNVNITYLDNSGKLISLSELTINPPLVVWLENTDGTRLDNFFTEGGQLDVDNALAAQDYVLALFSLDATGSFTLPNDNTVFRIKYLDALGEMVSYEIGTDATAHNPNAPVYWDDFLPLVTLGSVGNTGKIYFSANRLPTFDGGGILSSVDQTFTIEIERENAETSITASDDFTITLIGKDDPITALTALDSPSVPRFDDELLADPTRAVVSGQMVITDLDDNDAYRVRTEYTFTDIDSQVTPGAAVPIINDGETGMIDTPLGMLALNLDGKILTWTYTYDLAQIDVLVNPNDSLREDFRIVVEDIDIATENPRPLALRREDLIIKLFKRDNPPEFDGDLEGAVLDDANAAAPITATGTITGITDPDGTDVPAGTTFLFDGVDNVISGTYGTLRFVPAQVGGQTGVGGIWTYTLDRSLFVTRALTDGEMVEEQFFLAYQVTGGPGQSSPLYKMPITITITGADDPFEFVEPDGYSFNVNENSTDIVGIVRARDIDAVVQPPIGYAILEGAPAGLFLIKSNGNIVLKRPLNYESDPQTYNLVIAANDGTNTAVGNVQISVQDVDEFPEFAQSNYTADVKENTLADGSYVVATITATHEDIGDNSLRYTITDGNVKIASDIPNVEKYLFVMDEDSGVITLHGDLDFEAVSSYRLNIQVEDVGGNIATAILTVNVVDVGEYDFVGDLTGTATDDFDAAVPITATGTITGLLDPNRSNVPAGAVSVKDAVDDSADGTYGIFTYTKAPTGTGGLWEYVLDQTREATRTLSLGASPSVTETFTLLYTLADDPSITYATDIVITIIPDAYSFSFIERDDYQFAVDENTTSVGMVTANDPSAATPPVVEYRITSGDTTLFSIDEDSGVIRLMRALDYETDTREYDLTIEATDGTTTITIGARIDLRDVDEAPQFAQNLYEAEVAEDAVFDGTHVITTARATDEDAGDSVRYIIKSGNVLLRTQNDGTQEYLFDIDDDGVITLNGALDYENTISYTLEVAAEDNNANTSLTRVVINVTDVNENMPSFADDAVAWDFGFNADALPEDTPVNTHIATVTGMDDDRGAVLRYSFVGDAGAFIIDEDSGKISINRALDYETTQTYALTVQVDDGDFTDTIDVDIDITNIQEGESSIIIASGSNNIGPGVELVAKVVIEDPDGLQDAGAVAYRWFFNDAPDTDIETGSTYIVKLEDKGKIIGVERIYVDGFGKETHVIEVLDTPVEQRVIRVPDGSEDKDNTLITPENIPARVEGGNGADTIQDGNGDDVIVGGLGDDMIDLGTDSTGSDRDQVMYRIGDGVARDGNDAITGFQRGQDTLTFVMTSSAETDSFSSVEDFLDYISGGTGEILGDDQFLVMLDFDFFSDATPLLGLSFLFSDSVFFSGGRISMPIFHVTFAEPLAIEDVVAALNTPVRDDSLEKIRADGILMNLDYLDDLLGGEGAIGFEII